jgi:outer membrane lipase/esterase
VFSMRGLCRAAALWVTFSVSIAFAQNYNQFVAFGDSTTDSGWLANPAYKLLVPGFDNATAAAVAAGGNAHWTGPGPNNSQILAGFFGLTANPANTPGGTNYAIGGSFDSSGPAPGFTQYTNFNQIALGAPVPNPLIPSTSQQIDNYLASVGGRANPDALYLISSFGNDFLAADFLVAHGLLSPAAVLPYFLADEQALANRIAALQAAGARYIVVANQYGGFAGKLIEDNLWTDLAALKVKFIPADTNAVIAAVAANPAPFGIIFTSPAQPACTTLLALWCTTADLVAPNALQTHLFADSAHLTEAGQIIIADYYYSLLTAPSEISFLAETAVKARLGLASSIQNQIELSESHRGPSRVNAWVTGGVTSLSLGNFHGFPGDPDTLTTGAAGVDYAIAPGLIAGVAISGGSLTSALGTFGSFKQDETSASLYAAYRAGPLWGNVIGTYGHLNFNVNRNVPIGISIQNNTGSTSGDNWSAAFQGGYKFWNGGLTHGPVAGFIFQNVNVGAFTETGSFTSLAFGSQTRESDVGQLGYRASYDWAEYQPFLQATWNHEFADTGRSVTASLTTAVAPSYSLPAVILGKDWGEVKGGVTIDVGSGVKVLAVGSADFAQSSATVYGGQIGFNIAF